MSVLVACFVFVLYLSCFVLMCVVQCCCDLFGVVSVLLWFCLLCSVMLCCVLFLRLVFCLCVCSVCSALFYSVLFCCCWSILLRYAWKRCLCDECISFGSVDIWSQASLGLLCCASRTKHIATYRYHVFSVMQLRCSCHAVVVCSWLAMSFTLYKAAPFTKPLRIIRSSLTLYKALDGMYIYIYT